MLTKYIQAAMKQAKYEIFSDDRTFYGEIPICEGVYANAVTLEVAREELQEVLEDWILLGLTMNLPLPVLDNIDLTITKDVA
jgi:predicted RNase H-like HicB family nuclease